MRALRRDISRSMRVRGARMLLVATQSLGGSMLAASSLPSATASSSACAAPCPACGSIGCAASPSSVTRPRPHVSIGIAVEQGRRAACPLARVAAAMARNRSWNRSITCAVTATPPWRRRHLSRRDRQVPIHGAVADACPVPPRCRGRSTARRSSLRGGADAVGDAADRPETARPWRAFLADARGAEPSDATPSAPIRTSPETA